MQPTGNITEIYEALRLGKAELEFRHYGSMTILKDDTVPLTLSAHPNVLS